MAQWEAKALADGLPLPRSVLADVAALVVRGLGSLDATPV
jgi:hypothetical protein